MGFPKPTALRALEGNPGHRTLNRYEPQPPADAVTMPKGMPARARAEWKRLVPILTAMRVLTVADVSALEDLCRLEAEIAASLKQLEKAGPVVKTGNGSVKRNPFFFVVQDQRMMRQRMWREFGLTPSSRSRLSTDQLVVDVASGRQGGIGRKMLAGKLPKEAAPPPAETVN